MITVIGLLAATEWTEFVFDQTSAWTWLEDLTAVRVDRGSVGCAETRHHSTSSASCLL